MHIHYGRLFYKIMLLETCTKQDLWEILSICGGGSIDGKWHVVDRF